MAASALLFTRLVTRNVNLVSLISNASVSNAVMRGTTLAVPRLHLSTSGATHSKKEWFEVTYEKMDGTKFTVKGKEGDNLLDIAINNDLDLDGFGACEGTLACSTCHLVFKNEDFDLIEEPCTDEELDMLDLAYGLTDTNVCVSLSGCGFLGIYLIGAVDCLKCFSPSLLCNAVISGASAGALIAASVVCDMPLDNVRGGFLRTATEARKLTIGAFSPRFKFEDYLKIGLESLPEDAHIRARGRLHVSVTRMRDMSNVIFSDWESRSDLIQTLRCSCFILGFSGMQPPMLRGERYIDGGYSNKLPLIGTHTISISPLSGDVDICPEEKQVLGHLRWANHGVDITYSNVRRLYRTLMPPPPHVLNQYYYLGYKDALRFLKKRRKPRQNRGACVSLSGSGFLGIYQLGAIECLQRHWPNLFKKADMAGASAGAILAACLVCNVPMETMKSSFRETAVEAQKWKMGPFNPNFNIEDYLKLGLEALPADAHVRANDRLFLSLTKVRTAENVLVSNWESREELIQCLLCSCFIPVFSGRKYPVFRGEKYIDGGFSNNLPIIQQPAITISPFDSLVDICPRNDGKRPVYINIAKEEMAVTLTNMVRLVRALIPPPAEVLEDLFQMGYRDAYHFLKLKCSSLRSGKRLCP